MASASVSDDTRCVDIEIDDVEYVSGSKELLAHLRASWPPEDIHFQLFTEGYNNRLIACMLKDDEKTKRDVILIRIYGQGTELFVDRDRELLSMILLHRCGRAAEVYCRFKNGIAYGFMPGVVLDYTLGMDFNVQRLVAEELVRIQAIDSGLITSVLGDGAHFNEQPSLFRTLYRWLEHIPESFTDPEKQAKFESMSVSKAVLRAEVDCLHATLPHIGSPVVLCHNDLLFKNVIYNAELQRVTFIDFEYMTYNYQAYDIANYFCEYAGMESVDFSRYPDKEHQLKWLRCFLEYFSVRLGRQATDVTDIDVQHLYVQVNKFALAAHLFWCLWALAQAQLSTIQYDYLKFADQKLSEYRRRKDEFLALEVTPA